MQPTDSSSPQAPHTARGEIPAPSRFLSNDGLRERWLRVGLFILVCLLYLPGLGSFGLWDPWEVHYGEAARQLLERGDWLSPWWGSHWHPPGDAPEGEYFFSKPILQLWAMAAGMAAFGHTAFAVRLGTAIIAIGAVMSAYFAGERIWSRRVGLLMALTLATSPFFLMLSRQAQTDMPFVGLMSAALFFFMAAIFAHDREEEASRHHWTLFWSAILIFSLWQLQILVVALLDYRSDLKTYDALLRYGPIQGVLYLLALLLTFRSWLKSGLRTRRHLRLYTFYTLIALATLAKGLLGFLLPGAIIFVFILVKRDWTLLRRVELVRGIALTLVVGLPWYGGMIARHGGFGGAFWTRFIIHDHFKRLATGVHQIDTGSFEHFLRWLGYGLFPWLGFLPFSLMQTDRNRTKDEVDEKLAALSFLMIWAVLAFALFTASSTKFHHYIFPAVPPLALLAALAIEDLLANKIKAELKPLLAVLGIALITIVGLDILRDPQNLKNLFTYRYDRLWDAAAWDAGFRQWMLPSMAVSLAGFVLLISAAQQRLRRLGVLMLAGATLTFGLWTLHNYMPTISASWSQQGLWEQYYARCTPIEPPPNAHPMKVYCEEPVISYRLNWRGETFFTQNEVVPIRNDEDWAYFQEVNSDACYYAMMDGGRARRFANVLNEAHKKTVRTITTASKHPELQALDPELYERFMRQLGLSNNKFVLMQVNCDNDATVSTNAP